MGKSMAPQITKSTQEQGYKDLIAKGNAGLGGVLFSFIEPKNETECSAQH